MACSRRGVMCVKRIHIVIVDVGLQVCSRSPRLSAPAPKSEASEPLTATKEQQWALDFGTQPVVEQTLRDNLRVAAETLPRTGGEASVIAPIAGRLAVEKTFAVGTAVEKGTQLASVIPPTSATVDLASLQ